MEKFAVFAELFYVVPAKYIGKVAVWFNLPKFSTWLTRRFSKRPALLCLELFVAVALSVNFYLLVRPQCLAQPDGNLLPSFTFSYLTDQAGPAAKEMIGLSWKKRVAGPALAAFLIELKFKGQNEIMPQGPYQNIFGLYHAGWLFLLFLALIYYRRDSLLLMLGVFAGLMYNLSDLSKLYYPWDMPTMFFFTVAFLLYDRKSKWLLMLVVCIGGLFKETTLLCAILILLGENWTLKRRITCFVGVVVATLLLNKMMMAHYGLKSTSLALMNSSDGRISYQLLYDNVRYLFSLDLRHVLFSNAGTLLVIMLIPWRNHRNVIFKLIIIAFIIGQALYGIFTEVRIWYEMLPLGWMLISDALLAEDSKSQKPSFEHSRIQRVLLGSYWLMILAMLVSALGIRYFASDAHIVEALKSKALRGDARAQLQIAEHYQSGLGVAVDSTNAFQWFFKAADQGVAKAQYQLGLHYIEGSGTTKDISAGVSWLTKAAEQGNADAQCKLGVLYAQGEGVVRDFASSVRWSRQAAAQTNVDAEYNLGYLYENGLGVKQDLAEAAIWYERAGKSGHSLAQNNLGMICFNVRKDYTEAAQWFRKAADQGNPLSQNSLGVLYLNGLGVKADANEALKWFQYAAQKGQVDAQLNCGLLFYSAQRFNESAQWLHKAADQGNPEAQFNLGQFYQKGIFYPQDYGEAILWYNRSANQGNGSAELALGGMYQAGLGVKTDKFEAYKYFKLAQFHGVVGAENELTNCAAAMTADQIDSIETEVKKLQPLK